jgi:hypothetical protein
MNQKDYTKETSLMRTAMAMVGIASNDHTTELLLRLFDALLEKGPKFSLEDAEDIKEEMRLAHQDKGEVKS